MRPLALQDMKALEGLGLHQGRFGLLSLRRQEAVRMVDGKRT